MEILFWFKENGGEFSVLGFQFLVGWRGEEVLVVEMSGGRRTKGSGSFRELQVWERGMDLAEACYFVTRDFPREEIYGMTSQIRRAAAAIPANIAEGHGREATGDFARFLRIAQGSVRELETHLMLSARVGLAPEEEIKALLAECDTTAKMLYSLIHSIQRNRKPRTKN